MSNDMYCNIIYTIVFFFDRWCECSGCSSKSIYECSWKLKAKDWMHHAVHVRAHTRPRTDKASRGKPTTIRSVLAFACMLMRAPLRWSALLAISLTLACMRVQQYLNVNLVVCLRREWVLFLPLYLYLLPYLSAKTYLNNTVCSLSMDTYLHPLSLSLVSIPHKDTSLVADDAYCKYTWIEIHSG